jgi:hypothetical protein
MPVRKAGEPDLPGKVLNDEGWHQPRKEAQSEVRKDTLFINHSMLIQIGDTAIFPQRQHCVHFQAISLSCVANFELTREAERFITDPSVAERVRTACSSPAVASRDSWGKGTFFSLAVSLCRVCFWTL